MLTPTHLVLACALLTRRHKAGRNMSVVVGSLAPDFSMGVLTLYAISQNVTGDALWNGLYWQEPWQSLSALSNSFPLYWLVYLLGYMLFRWKPWAMFSWLGAFALAALLHLAFDFPFHVEDAHQHFWPLTEWRFHSPVSYWDDHHHASWVSLFESMIALIGCVVLWNRFRGQVLRIILALTMAFYIVILLMRYVLLTGH